MKGISQLDDIIQTVTRKHSTGKWDAKHDVEVKRQGRYCENSRRNLTGGHKKITKRMGRGNISIDIVKNLIKWMGDANLQIHWYPQTQGSMFITDTL